MSLEQRINYQLNKYPGVKKVVKSVYQHAMYAISPKTKSEGNIDRLSPDDRNHEYFFGYYDKCPWDITDRYVLCLRANNTWSDVSPREKAEILLIDTSLPETDQNRIRKIAETRAWNVQQSCMLQWMGPDFSSRILFNDYREGKYIAVIKDIESGAEQVIPSPVYTVSTDGKTALTLDFSRLYNLRPGYGYYNVPEKTKDVALPDTTAVWNINIESGEVVDILTYKDFASFNPRPEMKEKGAVHKVNHLMLNPSGRRFMVLYRWFIGERKYTRLITCNTDGTDMYVLADDDMVSHCFWKDDEHILAFENKKNGGTGYYLMKDKTQEYIHCWPKLTGDGHPSYNPNNKCVVTDSYPDRARIQYLYMMQNEKSNPEVIAKVFSPFKYDNDTRCDLHPRWNHSGDKICFDSVFEGHRGMYEVTVEKNKVEFIVEKNKQGIKERIKEMTHFLTKKGLHLVLHVFWVFPVKMERVSLINEQSFTYGDNLKYINKYINSNCPGKYQVFFPVKDGTEKAPNTISEKPLSLRYFKMVLTSGTVFTNCGGLSYLPKRRNQLFVNTWHGGGAYKKVGTDVWNTSLSRAEDIMNARNTDILFSSCGAFTDSEAEPMMFEKEQCLNTGLPRNDIFFEDHPEIKKTVFDTLGIKQDQKLVIYAPTYRSDTNSFANSKNARIIDIDYISVTDALKRKFGGEWRFGVRLHPRIGSRDFEDRVIVNCTRYPDMQELLYSCDAVITDYSSLMWDYSLSYKPCFIFAPDIDEYERTRGFYTPVSKWPFPIAKSNEELVKAIDCFSNTSYVALVREHHKYMRSYEKGTACECAVKLIDR